MEPKRPPVGATHAAEHKGVVGFSERAIRARALEVAGSTARGAAASDTCGGRFSFSKALKTVKRAVELTAYAGELTTLRRSGATLVGCCPLPNHEDRTPSFTVWPDNDSWWCFGCARGSDVIYLYYHLHGCSEMWEALVGLSLECGVELPGCSESRHRATLRKAEYRDAAYRVLGDVPKRRLYRTLVLLYIDQIEDPEEHERGLERSWRKWTDWWRWPHLAEDLIAGDEAAFRAVATAKAEADRFTSETTQGRPLES